MALYLFIILIFYGIYLYIYIYTCDSKFHASINHGSSLFHGSEARKSLAHMHCTRKIDLFRALFMGFSSIYLFIIRFL